MQRIEGDDPVGQVEFGQQALGGGNFVRLLIDFDVGERQRRIRREGTQYLFGCLVVEGIETAAQHLAVERKHATPALWRRRGGVQLCRMDAKGGLDVGGIEATQNRTD